MLSPDRIERLVQGFDDDPFALLGVHPLEEIHRLEVSLILTSPVQIRPQIGKQQRAYFSLGQFRLAHQSSA